jgi:hypothetical protein
VDKRADKTCNTITVMESRRLYDTVHLEAARCDGEAHGGCQAQCLLFWKESWLKRVEKDKVHQRTETSGANHPPRCNRQRLQESTRRNDASNGSEIAYRCQATELLKASEPLPWWDIRQYLRDVSSGNIGFLDLVKIALFRIFQKTLRITAYRAQVWAFNRLQSWRGGTPYPYLWGTLEKTPHETLGLEPGELVRVKSHEEILATLNPRNKNRGLRFDAEMVPYCGKVYRVRARVERIVDERTGKMNTLPRECLILDGVICQARYSEKRLFCPRSIYPYWREIWLSRVSDDSQTKASFCPSAELEQTPK